MNVSEVLAQAWAEVEKAELPAEIQRDAFRAAVRLIAFASDQDEAGPGDSVRQDAGAQRARTKRAPVKTTAKAADQAAQPSALPSLTEKEFLRKLAAETSVAENKLERIYHLHEGQPQISLPSSRLGANTKSKAVAIAQLIAVARAIAYHEDGTPISVIRQECRLLRAFSEKHFSEHVADINGFVVVGTRGDKMLKVRAAGEAAFPGLIDRLLGEAETE